MADGIVFDVSELLAMESKLTSFGNDTARKSVRRALQAPGKVLRDAIAARAPERPDERSPHGSLPKGRMRASVVFQIFEKSVAAGIEKKFSHIARFVEFGHMAGEQTGKESYRDKKGKLRYRRIRAKHVPPHPFIRPAFDESIEAAKAAFCTALAEEIARVDRRTGNVSSSDSDSATSSAEE